MDAGAFGVEKAGVELGNFAGGGAIGDNASEGAQAADALRDVLAAEHFENRVHAFTVRDVFDRFEIVALLVVDAMLQAEFADAGELVFGGRSPVHFDAENFSDLHGGGADSAGNGMNQDAGGLVVWLNFRLDRSAGRLSERPNRPSSRRSRR